jgi:predicted ATPase
MINRIRIKGYKSLRDLELALPRLTVIFGPNAAGKSNLLDAMALLSRLCTRRTILEAFEDDRGAPLEAFSVPVGGIEALQQQTAARFEIEADVALGPDVIEKTRKLMADMRKGLSERDPRLQVMEDFLRYRVTVEIFLETGQLRIVDERLCALTKNGQEKRPRSRKAFIERVENRLHLRLEGQAHPIYHDVGLDHTIVSSPLYPPHYPHISALKEEFSRWRFYYLEPNSMRTEPPLKEAYTLDQTGKDLAAVYYTLKHRNPAQFDAINKALTQLIPVITSLDVERTPEGLLRLSVTENGVKFSSRVISEGTLRILALLAILYIPPAPMSVIGLEEPENGVHPRRLSQVATLVREGAVVNGTQIIINTHSPHLPEQFDDEFLVCAAKDIGTSKFTPFSSYGPLFKRQDIVESLNREPSPLDDEPTPLSERILRGDYGD